MNIFLIGSSGTGKTPIATKIANYLGIKHVKASEYFRLGFSGEFDSRDYFNQKITEYSKHELSKNPRVNIEYLQDKINIPCVIESIRNPIEFTNLFDFKNDLVIYLNYSENKLLKTGFEKGIQLIENVCLWSIENKIMKEEQFVKVNFSQFFGENSLEFQIDQILKEINYGSL